MNLFIIIKLFISFIHCSKLGYMLRVQRLYSVRFMHVGEANMCYWVLGMAIPIQLREASSQSTNSSKI